MLIAYLVLINVITFYLYWKDKRNARNGRWRIPEKTLLGAALIGGSLGAFLGMYMFHHKTKHWNFKISVPVFLILHIMLLLTIFD